MRIEDLRRGSDVQMFPKPTRLRGYLATRMDTLLGNFKRTRVLTLVPTKERERASWKVSDFRSRTLHVSKELPEEQTSSAELSAL